jgi:hypothetical protein
MSRVLSRSLAVVALLAVVSAAPIVVTPSLARVADRDHPRRPPQPAWLWQSHVHGATSTPAPATPTQPHDKRNRRPYRPPVDRWSQP